MSMMALYMVQCETRACRRRERTAVAQNAWRARVLELSETPKPAVERAGAAKTSLRRLVSVLGSVLW